MNPYPYGNSDPERTPQDLTTPQMVPGESWESPVQPPPRRGRKALRLVVGTTAAALLLAGGVGVGTAIGESRVSTDTASSQSTTPTDGQAGSQQSQAQGPSSGPLYGGGQSDQSGSGAQDTDATTASGSQLTGLVRIQTKLGYANGAAAGTGMVLTSDGEVVTNHHVVEGATEIQATVMSTGKTYAATVVGTDAGDDVAVIQLQDASGLSTVKADDDAVAVGDSVTAVGDAGGSQTLSAASGTVSAVEQSIRTESEGVTTGERLKGLIEIDADVISGDSGGATYDGEGEVVGMTTAASSGSADITGYAIPIQKVLSIVTDLHDGVSSSSYVYGNPAFLGIGLAQDGGATVQGVYDDTPAAEAGIVAGDTITSIDGTRVSTGSALSKAIAGYQPGDRVQVTWTGRSGQTQSATVTLATGPVA